MVHLYPDDSISPLQELDLGQHTLCIRSDGSLDLFANEEQPTTHPCQGVNLDREETYRLFVSLHAQFTQQPER